MHDDREQAHAEDLAWVAEILAGSEDAWHRFVLRYSGLIQSVLRRYLFDPEQVRTVYVDVLDRLYHGKLQSYQGRAALSTRLVLVTRNAALDHLRRRLGRRELPKGLRGLSRRDQEIFQRYFVDGMSFEAVRHWAARDRQGPLPPEELAASLRRIEARVDERVFRRIAFDLQAPSVGVSSGRLLDFLTQHQREMRERGRRLSPDHALMVQEAEALAAKVKRRLAELPAGEREILTLRFEQGKTAVEIAEELGLSGPRRAYTLIERALRSLRRLMRR